MYCTMRRSLRRTVPILCAVMLVAACGSSGASDQSPADPADPAARTASSSQPGSVPGAAECGNFGWGSKVELEARTARALGGVTCREATEVVIAVRDSCSDPGAECEYQYGEYSCRGVVDSKADPAASTIACQGSGKRRITFTYTTT